MAGGQTSQSQNGIGAMGGTASSVPGTMNQGGYMANTSSLNPTSGTTPQWLQGMKIGQQLMSQGTQMGQSGQRPMMPQMAPRPMMGAGMPGGMPQQGVVPGSVPQTPQPMGTGGMGMQGGGQGQINPQLLQMLMRGRQQ